MRTLRTALIVPLLLVGCASPSPGPRMGYHWARPNTARAQWTQDDYACKRESERPYSRTVASPMAQNPLWAFSQGMQGIDPNAPVGVEAGVAVNEQLYVACMQARGYSYTIEPVPTGK